MLARSVTMSDPEPAGSRSRRNATRKMVLDFSGRHLVVAGWCSPVILSPAIWDSVTCPRHELPHQTVLGARITAGRSALSDEMQVTRQLLLGTSDPIRVFGP